MAIPSKTEKVYKVRDPIYGFVKLDAQEMDIVNSEYYQRLRRIKQLSLTDMVYPGATHTRFEHSLGVVQMASDMFDSIVGKEANLRRLELKQTSLPRIKKIIRLAALLHDIGHAPFSHAGEGSMPFLLKSDVRYEAGKNKRYEHEDYSIAAIKFIFRDYIENHRFGESFGIKAEDVTGLLGDKTVLPTRTSLIWGSLISGQLDADRADYLLRDSLHLGVDYGTYDRNRLVNCITLSSLDKGKQKTNNIIGCQPYTKHRFQQNRSGVFVCVLDIVTRSAPARFHRSVHGVSAGFIPRRRATHSTAGAACQGQSRRCAAVLRTLDWLSRLCYLPRRDGGYILQSRPLSLDRERAGG